MTEPRGVIANSAGRTRESWDDGSRGNASWVTLFSSDSTPTAAMSAGVMELPPYGGILERHRHPQAEIYFVTEGAGLLTIDGVETTISAHMAAFIPANAEHSLRNDTASPLRIFYVFPTDSFADVAYTFTPPGPPRRGS